MKNIAFMCIVRSNVQEIDYLDFEYYDFERYSRKASCTVNYIYVHI